MKKLSKLLLPLIVLLGPVQPSFARMEENGTSWWTVDEMLEFYQETEAEKEAECGDNQECKMLFNYSMYGKGPKYRALENFITNQFWITSVNPTNETIKVLFFDDEMMLKFMGINEKIQLEHLYIEWYEDWTGQVYNEDYEHFTNDYSPGMHKMYAGKASIDGPNWIPAWGEYELSVAGSSLSDNVQGIIAYTIFAENNMFNAQGSYDYFNCLHSPDYQEGTECKMYISGDQWISYFPPREQIADEIVTTQDESSQAQPSHDLERTPAETENGYGSDSSEVSQNFQSETNLNITDQSEPLGVSGKLNEAPIPKTPETGSLTNSPANNFQSILWFIMLSVAGIMLTVWWFLPTENQKNHKKLKKFAKKY